MTRLLTMPRNDILVGDAHAGLARLPEACIDMMLTSPPYFRLRNYGTDKQLGAEDHVADWVAALRDVAAEIHRVLTPTGSLWLNLGDTFSTHIGQGAHRKSLLLGPERLALALVEDGWLLRNKIVWSKTNYAPTSASDRLACSWEALYVFVKQPSYFFDLDAIRLPHRSKPPRAKRHLPAPAKQAWRGANSAKDSGLAKLKAAGRSGHPLGKNPGDVLRLPPSSYRGSHHATFPVALAEIAIRTGCPEARCVQCGAPWRRPVSRRVIANLGESAIRGALGPTCRCQAASEPGLVCDPFFGAGTTALGAIENGRDWLGIELSPDFAAEAARRIAAYQPVRAHQTGGGP